MEQDSHLIKHLDRRFDQLDSRLEKLDEKLDDHLGRISKAETEIHWIKGSSKIVLTILISILGFVAQFFWHKHN